MRATVIFVPGAFIADSEWWWRPVTEELEKRGIASRAVDLPSIGDEPPLGDLFADADAVRDAAEAAEGPVILVGHSYGGMVITEAGTHPKVKHLVYMSAFVPDGTSAAEADFMKPEDMQKFEFFENGLAGEGGTKSPILERTLDEPMLSEALSRLKPQAVEPGIQAPKSYAWRDKPSTFFVLTEDDDIAVQNQRNHAQRTTSSVEIHTNHYAHLERPDLVADALEEIASQLASDVEAVTG
ncbi:MAG TPA: alpha/beta hydrolase [Thermoleophilaceae bacterium]|jgi:pimeloyl-ACP methyl ester carboxylesterase